MISINEPLDIELQKKLEKLEAYIRELGSLAIGFSGGVDSTFLLAVAYEVLGNNVIAVTGADASVPERELKEAKAFCDERGIRHIICTVDPLKEEGYRHNSPDRCYFCKHGIFTEVKKIADENDIRYMAEGSNMDDIGDYRPGLKAAAELSVKSPLRECGLYKNDIRMISKAMGLPTWSKPAYACLASRFVYGEEITEKKLRMIFPGTIHVVLRPTTKNVNFTTCMVSHSFFIKCQLPHRGFVSCPFTLCLPIYLHYFCQ